METVRTLAVTRVAELFSEIRENPETQNMLQVMYAIRKVFPPKKNINKFITGGAVEEVLTRMIRSCGMECKNVSSSETVIDILVKKEEEKEIAYSVKSIQKMGSSVIIQNYRGQKCPIGDLCPTIFVVLEGTKTTFAYMDEEILQSTETPLDKIYTHADSNLTMKGGFVKNMIMKHLPRDLVLEIEAPKVPELEEKDISVLAVEYVMNALKK